MLEVQYMRCHQEHLALIQAQNRDVNIQPMYLSSEFAGILASHFALSAWAGSRCVGAAGFIPFHDYRAVAWAFLGADSGPYMRQISRKVRGALALCPYPRLELVVDVDFDAGHKWARMLGFTLETPRMRKHGLFGNDEALYVRIKDDVP